MPDVSGGDSSFAGPAEHPGVGVGGQLPVHSPTQTSGRAGDVDGSGAIFSFTAVRFIFFFSSLPWNTHVVFLYLQSE